MMFLSIETFWGWVQAYGTGRINNPADVHQAALHIAEVMNCPGYLGSRERMTAGTHCEEVQHIATFPCL